MARFIELTPTEIGVPILFNVEYFVDVRPTKEGGSLITTTAPEAPKRGYLNTLEVRESYNLIKRLLSNKSLDL